MWLLKRLAKRFQRVPEVLPPATAPTRRIEITVDRVWLEKTTRPVRGPVEDAVQDHGLDTETLAPKPPNPPRRRDE